MCSSAAINTANTRVIGDGLTYIASDMPATCQAYYTHEYTDLEDSVPVYIGEPLEGGFWAEQNERAAAQARYDTQLEERRRRGDIRKGDGQPPRSAYSTL